jgi:hypothetical protein
VPHHPHVGLDPDDPDAPPPVADCRHCGHPARLDEDHFTLALQLERDIPGGIVIGESRVVAVFHVGCVTRDPAGELVEPPRSA